MLLLLMLLLALRTMTRKLLRGRRGHGSRELIKRAKGIRTRLILLLLLLVMKVRQGCELLIWARYSGLVIRWLRWRRSSLILRTRELVATNRLDIQAGRQFVNSNVVAIAFALQQQVVIILLTVVVMITCHACLVLSANSGCVRICRTRTFELYQRLNGQSAVNFLLLAAILAHNTRNESILNTTLRLAVRPLLAAKAVVVVAT